MTPTRVAAAMAAILTALLLQAALIAPVTLPVPVSLPAVLVVAVALQTGPGTGMSLGFSAGLVADLGSAHPAGVLALAWLGLGLAGGLLGAGRRARGRQLVLAAVLCAVTSAAATLLLTALGTPGATAFSAGRDLVPAALGDLVLAAVLLPVSRRFLRTAAMRAPRVPRERPVLPNG